MYTVRTLCRPGSKAGFNLAGLEASVLPDGADPGPLIEELMDRPTAGVVLVEESIYDALPEDFQRRLERSALPIAVPFPGPEWKAAVSGEERVVELLRRAIGYRVRVR